LGVSEEYGHPIVDVKIHPHRHMISLIMFDNFHHNFERLENEIVQEFGVFKGES
jgi:hypothetical protein